MGQRRGIFVSTACVGLALLASPAAAQITASAGAGLSVSARATAAIQLPSAAIELRAAGVPAPEVHTALVTVHHEHIPAPEVHVLFTRSVVFVHEFGPPPSFGAFIQVKIGEGFRGPRLYDAVHVEFRDRGMWNRGLHKGHANDTPGHRRHGHSMRRGRGGEIRIGGMGGMGGMGRIRVRGPGARIDVRGGRGGGMGRVRIEGPSAMIRVRAPSAMVSVRGGGRGSVRVRGGGGGSVRVRGGGGGMGGMGMR